MNTIQLHVPYVYLHKEGNDAYTCYVIVAVNEGEDATFKKEENASTTEIIGKITGEKLSDKIVYKNAAVRLKYADNKDFDPLKREVSIGFEGKRYKRKMSLFIKDADANNDAVKVDDDFALNSPYIYLMREGDALPFNYHSKLLVPVQGYVLESEEALETVKKEEGIKKIIQLKKDFSSNELKILSDFDVNSESYKDDDSFEGFYGIIVEAGKRSISDLTKPDTPIPVSFSAVSVNSSCSETKVRSCGAESI